MKISIIIPVYNVERYIEKCLNSVKNQTYKNIEVIVVNDGTKDNSQTIINKFVKEDIRFHSYKKENAGLSDARNYGTNKATGDYIIFLDSDDYWDTDLLQNLVQKIEKSSETYDLIYFPKKMIDEDGKILKTEKVPDLDKQNGQNILKLFRKMHITFETACSYLINKEFWIKNNFFFEKSRSHEDMGLMPLVLAQAKNAAIMNKSFYNYIQREGSITTDNNYSKYVKRANDILYFYDFYQEKLKTMKVSEKTKEILEEYISTAVLERLKGLKQNDLIEYSKKVKERNVLSKIRGFYYRKIIKRVYYYYLLKKRTIVYKTQYIILLNIINLS